jgi:magnesium chelatase accessory protein
VTAGLDWARDGRDWPLRQHSRFVEAAGVRFHVQVLGSGECVLLLHGTGASGHSFRGLAQRLAGRFTVVVPDLPGHAFSRSSPLFVPSLEGIAQAVEGLLSALGLQPSLAIGHSAGAAILLQMSLRGHLPGRLLVGLASALAPFPGAAGLLFPPMAKLLARTPVVARVMARQARDLRNVERLVRSTGSTLDAEGVRLYQRLAASPEHVAQVLAMLARWDLERVYESLPRVRAPLLLLAGERDLAVPPQQQRAAAARVPSATLRVLAGLGHLFHEEEPALVERLVLEAFDAQP